MENSNFPKNRHNEHLGVNKMGRNIRKTPILQPNFGNPRQPSQPQVYNISKNDFRSIVQQLTGSPSQEPPPSLPPRNPPSPHPPRPSSLRLQKIRPPPLTRIPRAPIPPTAFAPPPMQNINNAYQNTINNTIPISPMYFRPNEQSFPAAPSFPPGDSSWSNPAESPITACMRYLQNSILESGSKPAQIPPPQPQPPPQYQHQGQGSLDQPQSSLLPTPPVAAFPSPRGNYPPLLPSPTSQFPMPSPSSFLNLFSPRSPYPILSPMFPYPLTPNFSFSPLSQPGILGPGPQPPSPCIFPPSPSGFFPILSPRWRDQ